MIIERLIGFMIFLMFYSCAEPDEFTREEALALGNMVTKDHSSPYIIAAPHGKFDLNTADVVESVCINAQWNCLIASGYRTEEHPINVNRPTEGVGLAKYEEQHTDRARYVYEEYLARFSDIQTASFKLYVEIHGNSRPESQNRIEIATVGLDSDESATIKEELILELTEAGLSDLNVLIEGDPDFHFHASAAKAFGILKDVETALHLEIPIAFRSDRLNELTEALKKTLPPVLEKEFR